ncbi:contactin [Plakobranchus ocellatus]|uniref:Contactin n=1 Tax=Plakobranchus ocellatus TaxID=259542 RepID=A0AAV3ZEX7_9GAST|nr:contactin [Plakobranchus ocellatus]
MEVWWSPVPDTRLAARGKILGYQINYWHESEVATDYKLFIRHEGQVDTGIVIGLVSDNFYWFTVQVYNSAGLGSVSEFFYQESLHAPAQTYPQEVRVYSAGRYEVIVWWRGVTVEQPESTIDGYVIYYWPAYEHYRTATEHISEGRLVYTARIKVEPGVVYALRVAAFSVGGFGRKSQTTGQKRDRRLPADADSGGIFVIIIPAKAISDGTDPDLCFICFV